MVTGSEKLCVDRTGVRADADGPERPEAYRMAIQGVPELVYMLPEFHCRKFAERFLAILQKRGLDTVAAFDNVTDEEIARIIAEEITLW